MKTLTCRTYRLSLLFFALGCGACGPATGPDELPEAYGPALTDVMADDVLTCEEHYTRNQYNVCPDLPPSVDTDQNGVTWSADLFLGLLPNPFHWPLECYRGTSAELGLSSCQCCYADGQLVSDGSLAGSFDFVFPYWSPLTAIWHFFLDILPPWQCGE